MISTRGLAPLAALALVERQGDRFVTALKAEPVARREIEAFRDRIGKIGSVDELVKDHQVFGFVMKAFGLEREIFAKAMMKRILTADPGDKKSLVNRLTDPRYREINKVMGFGTDGKTSRVNFDSGVWAEAMVDRFASQRMIDRQMDDNPAVGVALDFERKVRGLTSWYKVLADPKMAGFFRTAFGLPETVAQGDIDGQARLFKQRMKIEELQDPQVRKKLVRQYAAIEGVLAQAAAPNGALELFTRPKGGAGWSPVMIDVTTITPQSGAAYRTWR